jgi:hypothetical protein
VSIDAYTLFYRRREEFVPPPVTSPARAEVVGAAPGSGAGGGAGAGVGTEGGATGGAASASAGKGPLVREDSRALPST